MPEPDGLLRRLAGVALALALALPAVPAWADEGPLRATLRERLAERRAERAASPAGAGGDAVAPGQTGELRLRHEGRWRRALVHVPRRATGAGPLPLLLAFHGGGGSAEFMADDEKYGLISASEREGFLLVLPQGTGALGGDKLATWNAGRCCGRARDEAVDDVGFVRALVAHLQAAYRVDPQRVFATGMSNGGMMAHRLACEMADTFRAVASVAGTDVTTLCLPSRPIAVLHLHARDDDHVLYEGGAGPGAFRDERKVTDFSSVPETLARWVRRNQCTGAPQRVLERPGAMCETYTACAGGAQVGLCVTETGGHAWPGGGRTRPGKPPPSQALDAHTEMWRFFRGL